MFCENARDIILLATRNVKMFVIKDVKVARLRRQISSEFSAGWQIQIPTLTVGIRSKDRTSDVHEQKICLRLRREWVRELGPASRFEGTPGTGFEPATYALGVRRSNPGWATQAR